jgi:hypothetical protein
MMQMPVLTAPLVGVPSGLQSQGPWAGRRQLFLRFAGEAETATMYRADALAREITRNLSRSAYHSISISGRDAMASTDFLLATFAQVTSSLPVMIDTDGRKPDAVTALGTQVSLVQVSMDVPAAGPNGGITDQAMATLRAAAGAGREHALVLLVRDEASDEQLLRIVEQAHAASTGTMLVVHPGPAGERPTLDRRWSAFSERACAVHGDVRVALRLPGPAGMR